MRLTWYGHAAFLIETEGLRIILDPYRSPDSGGYEPIAAPADLVVVSHENDRYHSHLGQIVPPFEVVRGLEVPEGGRVVRGIRFEAVRVFETPERRPEDEVTIIHFRAEGLDLVHRGELPREAHRFTHLRRLPADVESGHGRRAGVRLQQRGEDAHERGLARAVRAEQGEDAAARDLEVDAAEDVQLLV